MPQVPPAQLLQAPLQAELQQTPATQCPLPHWVLFEHAVPFPNVQSMSWPLPQVPTQGTQLDGQKPSEVPLQGRDIVAQANVQLATVPDFVLMLFASLTQASDWVWQALGGSQVSPFSMTELPQTGVQS